MAAQDDNGNEDLRRRVARAELLATLAFLAGGAELDPDTGLALRRYLRGADKDLGLAYSPDLNFLFDRLIYDRYSSPAARVAERVASLESERGQLEERLKAISAALSERADATDEAVASLRDSQRTLSAETHQWLALQSLGISDADIKTARFVPLRVYLSDTPNNTIERVTTAINHMVGTFGFGIADEFPEVRGSWWKKWFARGQEIMTQPEVAQRLKQLERAVQLQGLGQPQADIDAKQAGAVADLMKALTDVPNAALQVGSILLIKLTSKKGPMVQVRTLTQQELIHLENNQNLLNSPADLLERLALLCQPKPTLATITVARNAKKNDELGSKGGPTKPADGGIGLSNVTMPSHTKVDHIGELPAPPPSRSEKD